MESSAVSPVSVPSASLLGSDSNSSSIPDLSSLNTSSNSNSSSSNGLSTSTINNASTSASSISETKSTSSVPMSNGKRRMIDYFRKELQDQIDEAMVSIKEWKPSEDKRKPRLIDMDLWAVYPFPKKMENRYGVKFIEFTTFVHCYDGNIDSTETSFTSDLSYVGYCGEDASQNILCDTLEEAVDAFLHTFNNSYFCHKCKVVNFKAKNYNPFTNGTSSSSTSTNSSDGENPSHNMVCPKCTFYIEASSLCEERDKLLRECSICYVTDIPSVKAAKLTCSGAAKHSDFICRDCLLKNGGICPQCREPPVSTIWTEDDEEDPIDLGSTGGDDSDDDDDEDDDGSYDGDEDYQDGGAVDYDAGSVMEEVD